MAKPKTKKKTALKAFSVVYYVVDSSPKLARFKTKKDATVFIEKFQKENPSPHDGYWIDFLISDVRGDITYFDEAWTGE
jgi:hypothetical protein